MVYIKNMNGSAEMTAQAGITIISRNGDLFLTVFSSLKYRNCFIKISKQPRENEANMVNKMRCMFTCARNLMWCLGGQCYLQSSPKRLV